MTKPIKAHKYMNLTLAQRFALGYVIADNGCWVWMKSRNVRGYGSMRVGKKLRPAHQLSYEIHIGPIPHGMFVCHHCDNPPCCNPAHLYAGSAADNVRDRHARNRHRQPMKLTRSDVNYLRGIPLWDKPRLADIATSMGMHVEYLRRVQKGRIEAKGWI